MDQVDLTQFDDDSGFTVQFLGPPGLIAVDTLVGTLSGFAEALRAIGDLVEPEFELEVYVDSVVPGSIKIGVKLKKRLKTLGVAAVVGAALTSIVPKPREVITGLFTSYLYDKIKPDEKCTVVVTAEKVTIKGQHCDVTVTREVYELRPRIEAEPKVAQGVKRALQAVKKDKAVESIGVSKTRSAPPAVFVERTKLDDAIKRLNEAIAPGSYAADAPTDSATVVPQTRMETVRTNLVILKAWLERGRRKWRFNWQGMKISAAIRDPDFFDQLESRSIALRQGDALDADLSISQRFLPAANVWENFEYTVTRVYSVKLGETQTTMDFAHYPVPQTPPAQDKNKH